MYANPKAPAAIEEPSALPVQRILREAAALRAHRGRPCLVLVDPCIDRWDVYSLRRALGDARGEAIDVLLCSNGGDIDGAYLMARELKRRFGHVAVYVPQLAKSAAVLFCLAADELVLGDLGELGPLDAQCDERQQADFPLNTSRLGLFKALEQLQSTALDSYEDALQRVVRGSGMRPSDAGTKAAEVIASLFGPIYGKIDPIRVADAARSLEVGSSYALRILARYRPEIPEAQRIPLVHRLIHSYPSHGFVIDTEELAEFGLPTREPDPVERAALDRAAVALRLHNDQGEVFNFEPGEPAGLPGGEAVPGSDEAAGPRGAVVADAGVAGVAAGDAGMGAERNGARSGAEVEASHE